jgi:hypothetical protein
MIFHGLSGGTRAPVLSATWGNGEAIPSEVVARCQAAMWPYVVGIKLAVGDLLVMDNRQMQHGKLPHEGEYRNIWVQVSESV